MQVIYNSSNEMNGIDVDFVTTLPCGIPVCITVNYNDDGSIEYFDKEIVNDNIDFYIEIAEVFKKIKEVEGDMAKQLCHKAFCIEEYSNTVLKSSVESHLTEQEREEKLELLTSTEEKLIKDMYIIFN